MPAVQPAAGESREKPFRLAHLSDPHLTTLQGVRWRELLNKRLLGYASWRWRRRAVHLPAILDALQRALAENPPDHIAITGDLTHLGTPKECLEARRWLEQLGPPGQITVIPGNHDRYVQANWSETVGQWLPYMRGDEAPRSGDDDVLFPSLRIRGRVSLIGLSTARPTAPFLATGRLGQKQLDGLDRLLERTGAQGLFRVVLLHHSPVFAGVRRGLDDSEQLVSVLRRRGAELILHGHGHRPVADSLHAGSATIPIFGVGSASSSETRSGKPASYNVYEIVPGIPGWAIRVFEQRWDPERERFVPHAQRELVLPGVSGNATK